ncbi:hypothetical protein MLD38_020882 [Melastoma candidum]|uniref:Uncharacterized protein n=1 Tax=Melastoma candidum TaxID=119954 RepID=A0ACB9QE98_9MYRT|nr:hypothetical protein MLD38_020882 [Melastoma candidum]
MKPHMPFSSQLAANDYIVYGEGRDVFVINNDGNMTKILAGRQRYMGYKWTIRPNAKKLGSLFIARKPFPEKNSRGCRILLFETQSHAGTGLCFVRKLCGNWTLVSPVGIDTLIQINYPGPNQVPQNRQVENSPRPHRTNQNPTTSTHGGIAAHDEAMPFGRTTGVIFEVEPPSPMRYLIGAAIMMIGVVFPVGYMMFRNKRVPSYSFPVPTVVAPPSGYVKQMRKALI